MPPHSQEIRFLQQLFFSLPSPDKENLILIYIRKIS